MLKLRTRAINHTYTSEVEEEYMTYTGCIKKVYALQIFARLTSGQNLQKRLVTP